MQGSAVERARCDASLPVCHSPIFIHTPLNSTILMQTNTKDEAGQSTTQDCNLRLVSTLIQWTAVETKTDLEQFS